MKVLHYIPSIDRSSGGVGSFMQLLAKPLGALSELHVATHQESDPLPIENAEVHYMSKYVCGPFQKQWGALLDALHPDIVHINSCWLPGSAIAQRIAQRKGYKVVLTPHGMLEPWILKRHHWTKKVPALILYQKAAVKKADMLQATAYSEKEHLLKLAWNENVCVIPNGVEIETIEVKKSWERRKKILFLSRIHEKKGADYLIKAVARLKDEFEGYEVIIAGEGEPHYIHELKALSESLGVSEIIKFVGAVYGEEKWKLFQEADVFVLPSHSENFGIVVAEALASGTPVITTYGTPWSELNSKNCGWHVEVGTKPLAKALVYYLHKSEEELEEMGRNGRMLVENKYSVNAVAQQVLDLYCSMLKK